MARKGYLYGGIIITSAATLMFQLTLTRLFAVSEWYHFAFLSISVTLLGYACSGTILSLLSAIASARLDAALGVAFPISILGAYLAINWTPFDSYCLAWGPNQFLYMPLYYATLVVPFAIGGFIVARRLSMAPETSHLLYAANLVGSALGCLGLLLILPAFGGEGTVIVSSGLGALGTMLMRQDSEGSGLRSRRWSVFAPLVLVGLSVFLLWFRPSWTKLRLSPYKSLSYALQASDAHLDYQRWNSYSRIDVVKSQQIHSAPGLSLGYSGKLPPQYGLTVDGADLSPLSRRATDQDSEFLAYLPSSVAYRLRPQASTLILKPRGGMDVAVALESEARRIVVVEDNPLVTQVVGDIYGDFVGRLYQDPRVTLLIEGGRTALQRGSERFDIVLFSLTDTYHPLTSGPYSLAENYLYTIEALDHALRRLRPDGLLVITRWLQNPPSESVRAAALIVAALERRGVSTPAHNIVAFRSWSTMTLLASPSPLQQPDIDSIQQTCDSLGYDPVYYPGMRGEEANRHNQLPDPLYYEAFRYLLSSDNPQAFYQSQLYDVSPPSDNRPFFGHYFRWRQIPVIVRQLGKTWQPFGGSGYLIVLAFLGIATLASVILILLPLRWGRTHPGESRFRGRILVFFAAVGLGYMLVEIPLMQQFILYLGQPALAFIVVVAALLVFSGIGSVLAKRARLQLALPCLVIVIALYPGGLGALFDNTLHLAWGTRVAITIACLLPLGILMGIPFAGGIRNVERIRPGMIPWLWAINGSASVVSSILAMVIALSGGYRLVLAVADVCYLVGTIAFWPLLAKGRSTETISLA